MNEVGTTAPLSPNSQEPDMTGVRAMFDKAINAMVDATKLAHEVGELRKQVFEINESLEYLRKRNAELDGLLHDVRRQRDEAQAELNQVKSENRELHSQIEGLTSSRDSQERVIAQLNDQLDHTSKDRDEYGLKAMAAEDRANLAEGKLKDIQATLSKMFPQAEPANVHAVNEPAQARYDSPPPVHVESQPEPTHAPAEVDWNKPYHWNSETGKYENH